MPSPAVPLVAAEAKTPLPRGAATRLALIFAPVQLAPAVATELLMRLFGHIGIDFFQQLVYVWICQMVVAPIFSD